MTPGAASGPLAPTERLRHLDILRGLAICGIAFVNVELFVKPWSSLLDAGAILDEPAPDQAIAWTIRILAGGRFLALFALLFGAGLALQRDRVRGAGRSFGAVATRRLLVLAALGVAHGYGLFWGDILLIYGAVALVVVSALWMTCRALAWTGAASVAVGLAMLGTKVLGIAPVSSGGVEFEVSLVVAIRSGYVVHVFGLMLIGAAAARAGLATRRTGWWPITIAALGAGSALELASVAIDLANDFGGGGWGATAVMLHRAAGPVMAVGYAGLVVALTEKAGWWTVPLARTGRLALTNYVLQSVAFLAVASSWGLGWWDIGRPIQMGVAAAVVGVEIAVSTLWLQWMRRGPLELAWRGLTYGPSAFRGDSRGHPSI